jgi:phosphoribosyl 1,2-cyclic phosphodiesterase
MRVHSFGTRGSVPVSGSRYSRYGGNTTCFRIESECLPPSNYLVVDAGTGIVPLGYKALEEGVQEVTLLFTHFHHDHTQGIPLCPITFCDSVKIDCYGPEEHGIGPRQMLTDLMRQPYFPVSFVQVDHHFSCKGIKHPQSKIMVIHPDGGLKLLEVDELARAEQKELPQIRMKGGSFPLNECLVIRMWRTTHPERAISYRFEERPTGKVFVLMTDNENVDGLPQDMIRHLTGTDLLVIDSQYSREMYESATAGFGHGTPGFCVRVAKEVGITNLGLTHHHPGSSDVDVDTILEEARAAARSCGFGGNIRAMVDYEKLKV